MYLDDSHDGHYNDTDTSDQALVSVDDSGEEDGGPTVSYAGIIVGTFFALFIVMLVIAFFGYRQYRRQNKSGAHWEGLSREEGSLAGSLFRRRQQQQPPDIAEMSMFNNGLQQILSSSERRDEGRSPIVPPTLGLS